MENYRFSISNRHGGIAFGGSLLGRHLLKGLLKSQTCSRRDLEWRDTRLFYSFLSRPVYP